MLELIPALKQHIAEVVRSTNKTANMELIVPLVIVNNMVMNLRSR